MVKRIISLILILLLLSHGAFANEFAFDIGSVEPEAPVFKRGIDIKGTQLFGYVEESESAGIFANMSLAEYVFAYIDEHIEMYGELPTLITVGQFGATRATIEKEFTEPMLKNPYSLVGGFGYYLNSSNIITAIVPRFLVSSVEEMPAARKAIEDGVKEYVELANQYDTDLEKLLAIHDKMVELCVYDDRVMSSDPDVVAQAPRSVYYALGVFRDKFAVCQGYAQATYLICNELGIGVDLCTSDEANHMWNYINLDGKWYHYDMTHDDPEDSKNRAYHRNFMVSDSALPAGHGTDWRICGSNERYDCSDTTYETNHFFNITTPFLGYREEDGFYHIRTTYTSAASEINKAPIDFKTKNLYTGPVVVTSFLAEGVYYALENGEEVKKKATNLYMVDMSTRAIGESFAIIQRGDVFRAFSTRGAISSNRGTVYTIFSDISRIEAGAPPFTAFVLGAKSLEPYAFKTTLFEGQ